jgi:hypothetical protein
MNQIPNVFGSDSCTLECTIITLSQDILGWGSHIHIRGVHMLCTGSFFIISKCIL